MGPLWSPHRITRICACPTLLLLDQTLPVAAAWPRSRVQALDALAVQVVLCALLPLGWQHDRVGLRASRASAIPQADAQPGVPRRPAQHCRVVRPHHRGPAIAGCVIRGLTPRGSSDWGPCIRRPLSCRRRRTSRPCPRSGSDETWRFGINAGYDSVAVPCGTAPVSEPCRCVPHASNQLTMYGREFLAETRAPWYTG